MSQNNSDNRSDTKVYLPFIFALVLAGGILLGYLVSINTVNKPSALAQKEYNKIDDILDFTEVYYVDTVDRKDIEREAIDDILSGLDPHSFYIDASELQGVNDDLKGNFEGIGVEFSIVDDTIMVVTPITGGPSEELGVLAGDKIVMIDDSLVAGVGVTNKDVMSMLKGPKGSIVKINVQRLGSENIDFDIKRDKIPIFSVDVAYMITNDIAFIKINRFSATTYDEFNAAIRNLRDEGAEKLIIDLRQNPGGFLGAAVQIADELLPGKKLVVYTEGKSYPRMDYYAERPGYFEQGDVAILIDQNSASASEILAGAVQDWDRGVVLGRRSYGKGLVQNQYDLQDNSALRLTIARYYTPSGRSIQKPYDDDLDAYHDEVYERYDNGEMMEDDSVKLSDTTSYFTKVLGREVFAGGGIKPDIFMPLDTNLLNSYVNGLRRYIPEFIYGHYSSNTDAYEKYKTVKEFNEKFVVNDVFFEEFLKFAEAKDWKGNRELLPKYRNKMKTVLKAFLSKQIYQNEGYFSLMNEIDPMVQRAINELNKGVDLQ